MTDDKGIFIKNIYYMLTYAFRVLRQSNYDEIAAEEFERIEDLFAAILAKGISQQLKQGLYREYVTVHESLPVMRGKLDIYGTIKNERQRKRLLDCEYDELSENNIYNQILKTTAAVLLKEPSVKKEHRCDLKKVLLFFNNVETVQPSAVPWNLLRYQHNNKSYEMLMNLCYFVLNGMLQTTEKGSYKMNAFSEEHMHRLYERFILEYFKQHHTYLSEVKAAQVKWNLDPENDEAMIRFLPAMQTDITLRLHNTVLIIDAKYYGRTLQCQYDKYTLHSHNFYQIFAYVKNQAACGTDQVAGMLLYAKTQESITPDVSYRMGGNRISVKTLDLNTDFRFITAQLDNIAMEHFGPVNCN